MSKEVAKRMLWLAYEASLPVGMGMLHYTEDKTEDDVFENNHCVREDGTFSVFADYCFGRMMKFGTTSVDGVITSPAQELDVEYQSWCSTYPSYSKLEAAARESLLAEAQRP